MRVLLLTLCTPTHLLLMIRLLLPISLMTVIPWYAVSMEPILANSLSPLLRTLFKYKVLLLSQIVSVSQLKSVKILLICSMKDPVYHLVLLHSNPALYMIVGSHLQGMDSFQSICFPQLALLPIYGEIKATGIMPKGYAITLIDAIDNGLTFTLKTFVHNGGSTTRENVSWFPPDTRLPSIQPNLQLLKKLLAQDSLEALSLNEVRHIEKNLTSYEQWEIWSAGKPII